MPATQHNTSSMLDDPEDLRPRFGIGHMSITAADVESLTDFYAAIGMRLIVNMGRMSIVELRGGTHLIIGSGEAGVANLDLIVDDIDATRSVLETEGASVGDIRRGSPHDQFIALDPEGNRLVVNSNHAMGVV